MPCGAEELVLVEHDREDPPQLRLVDQREQPPPVGVRARAGGRATGTASAKCSTNSSARSTSAGLARRAPRRRTPSPRTAAAARRASAPCSGIVVAVGHPHHVVEEAVLLVPQRRVGARRVQRDRDPARSARRTSARCRRRPGRRAAELDRDLQHPLAVQRHPRRAVGLARACRRPGSGAERSKMPMLSSPRKPPWKRLRPSGSLRLTHQVKFVSSRWKTRARNSRSPSPRISASRS